MRSVPCSRWPKPGKRGPDLRGVGQRLNRRWFNEFVRDPIRVSRRMEMPSIGVPVMGVLDDDLNEQLAAVWHVLSDPEFQPPQPQMRFALCGRQTISRQRCLMRLERSC